MNRNLLVVTTLGVGMMSAAGMAQAPAAPRPAAPAPAAPAAAAPPAAPVVPEAIPAKIALVAFEQAVFATNEGQKAVQEVQKKYEPQKAKIDALSNEIDGLKKQLASLPATATAEDRASKQRVIDTKDKELQRQAEDAQQSYNAELQDAYGKVASEGFGDTEELCVAERFYAAAGREQPVERGDVGAAEYGCDGCSDSGL